uniref:DNA polymerase n=1 Tax=Coniophora puteana TaxID=80637 RepID=A0A896YUJ2_9AGAM
MKWDNVEEIKQTNLQKFTVNERDYLLPLNRNYRSWGESIFESEELLIISVVFDNLSGVITVKKEDIVSKVKFMKGKTSLIEFTDSHFKDKVFLREFPTGEKFYIKNSKGDLILQVKPVKTDFLEKILAKDTINRKIGTLDIETIVKNGVHNPYLFAFYDGTDKFTWFDKNADSLFEHILSSKYRGYTIYAHNLSRFDIVFLF